MISFSFLKDGHSHLGHMKVGLWCLAGLLGFLLLEKGFADESKEEEMSEKGDETEAEKDLLVRPNAHNFGIPDHISLSFFPFQQYFLILSYFANSLSCKRYFVKFVDVKQNWQ